MSPDRETDHDDANNAALLQAVYSELRRLAAGYMRREAGHHTLQATALVHEAYLRLVERDNITWKNRSHFVGVAAQMMRRILMDHARVKGAAKRGGSLVRVSLDADLVVSQESCQNLLDLDAALTRLQGLHPRAAKVVELKYFGGLEIDQIAEALGSSSATVKRHWNFARAWLQREVETDT